LLSKEYAANDGKLIDPSRAAKTVAAGQDRYGDTIYMCAADDEGHGVADSKQLSRHGQCIVVPGLASCFKIAANCFRWNRDTRTFTRRAKRPFHTIIPGFVMKDGKPWEAFGVMGGGMQPQGHVQVLTNQLDFSLNVQEAGDASRWQHEGDNEPTGGKWKNGGYVNLESGIPRRRNAIKETRTRCACRCRRYGGYQRSK